MQCPCLVALLAFAGIAVAQTGPVIVGMGYSVPVPLNVAPGQAVTLLVPGIANVQAARATQSIWPTKLSSITVNLEQGSNRAVPILEVRNVSTCNVVPQTATCGSLTAITVQIPFNILTFCGPCATAQYAPTRLSVAYNGVTGPVFEVNALADQIHVLTACDTLAAPVPSGGIPNGLPCQALVTHRDNSLVSFSSPAKPGEELIAYVVGLGNIVSGNPVAGEPFATNADASVAFSTQFNFTPNALPVRPVTQVSPIFAGATAGFAGLYQINFRIPAAPAGTPPCAPLAISQYPVGATVIQSNLTVSFGGAYSFDGAALCVAVP